MQQNPTVDLRDGMPIPPPSLGLSSGPLVGLPSRKVCERCCVTFLSQINSLVYIISPEKLFEAVDGVYSGRDHSLSVQAMIGLVVALVDDSPEHSLAAPVQMEAVIEQGSIESVQAIILMVRCNPTTE